MESRNFLGGTSASVGNPQKLLVLQGNHSTPKIQLREVRIESKGVALVFRLCQEYFVLFCWFVLEVVVNVRLDSYGDPRSASFIIFACCFSYSSNAGTVTCAFFA